MALINRVKSVARLSAAWEQVRSSQSTLPEVEQFTSYAQKNIRNLANSLKNGTFRFSPYHAFALTQGQKKRPIMTTKVVGHRIVQKSLLNVVYPLFKQEIENEASFGSIRKRSIEDCARRIAELHEQGYTWVFESDIIDFFNAINRETLLRLILTRCPDRSIDLLLKDAIKAEIENRDEIKNDLHLFPGPDAGIPQGSILSPLFANVYLTPFDRKIQSLGYKLVRYVDDFIILCRSEKEATEAYKCAEGFLSEIKLKIHPLNAQNKNGKIKTKITPFEHGFDFLGIHFDSHRLQPCTEKMEGFKKKVDELTKFDSNPETSILYRLTHLNLLIDGWGNAYRFCNMAPVFYGLDIHIRERVSYLMYKHFFAPKPKYDEKELALLGIKRLGNIELNPIYKKKEPAADVPVAEAVTA